MTVANDSGLAEAGDRSHIGSTECEHVVGADAVGFVFMVH